MEINIKNQTDLKRLRNIIREGLLKAYKYAYVIPFISFESLIIPRFLNDFKITLTYDYLLNLYCSLVLHKKVYFYGSIKDINILNNKLNNTDIKCELYLKARALPMYNYNVNIVSKFPNKQAVLIKNKKIVIDNIKVSYMYNLNEDSNFLKLPDNSITNYLKFITSYKSNIFQKCISGNMYVTALNLFCNFDLWYTNILYHDSKISYFDNNRNLIYISTMQYNNVLYISSFIKCLCQSVIPYTRLKYEMNNITPEDIEIICDIAAASILKQNYIPYNCCMSSEKKQNDIIKRIKESDKLIDMLLFLTEDIVKIVHTRLEQILDVAFSFLEQNRTIPDDEQIFPELPSLPSYY